jgi:small-conductance mechanosensitive channel
MLKGLIDDLKNSTGNSLRMTSLVALAGFAGFVALCFLCAAGFIAVMQHYGVIEACLAIAGIFIVVAAIIAQVYAVKQRRARERAAAAARAAARAAANAPLIDPMMIATGIQIARTLGLKKLIPLLALAGVAVGYMANRNSTPADDEEDADEQSEAAAE